MVWAYRDVVAQSTLGPCLWINHDQQSPDCFYDVRLHYTSNLPTWGIYLEPNEQPDVLQTPQGVVLGMSSLETGTLDGHGCKSRWFVDQMHRDRVYLQGPSAGAAETKS